MTWQDYEQQKIERFQGRTKMAAGKAKEYAKEDDRLANFKEAASVLGVHPLTVAMVYWYKHVSAVATFCRKVSAGEVPELSEPIGGRIDDCQEYLDIIAALIIEESDTNDGLRDGFLKGVL